MRCYQNYIAPEFQNVTTVCRSIEESKSDSSVKGNWYGKQRF